jgi:hypothetical protein
MRKITFLLFTCLFLTITSCKKKIEAPIPFIEKLAICDSLYNFDLLAQNGALDRNSFQKYEDCLCNTIAPNADLQTDDGLNLTIKKLRDTALVLYTWSQNKPGYIEDMLFLKKMQDDYKGKLKVVSLSMFDPVNMPPEIPTGAGSMSNVIMGIEVIRTGFKFRPDFPIGIFIDKNGIVRDFFSGLTYNFSMSKEDREERIKRGIKKII